MPSDYILATGHFLQIIMNPPETYPTLIAPIPLIGSGSDLKIMKLPACLEGDETPVLLMAPQVYMSPTYYTIPGMGTVTIKITSSNTTQKTKNGGTPILITGQTFQVEFDVTVPATYINEASGATVVDSAMKKNGTAQFINLNVLSKAG